MDRVKHVLASRDTVLPVMRISTLLLILSACQQDAAVGVRTSSDGGLAWRLSAASPRPILPARVLSEDQRLAAAGLLTMGVQDVSTAGLQRIIEGSNDAYTVALATAALPEIPVSSRPILLRWMRDERVERRTRFAIARRLLAAGESDARPLVEQALGEARSASQVAEIAKVLAGSGSSTSLSRLAGIVGSNDPLSKDVVAPALLAHLANPASRQEALHLLQLLLRDRQASVRYMTAGALAAETKRTPEIVELMRLAAMDDDPKTRAIILRSCPECAHPTAPPQSPR